MKNIAAVGVLERIRRLAPQGSVPPYRTVEEWREWQLKEIFFNYCNYSYHEIKDEEEEQNG